MEPMTSPLVAAAKRLHQRTSRLTFASPVEYVYMPLDYAWSMARAYLEQFGQGPKRWFWSG